jgi:hypothetical protein
MEIGDSDHGASEHIRQFPHVDDGSSSRGSHFDRLNSSAILPQLLWSAKDADGGQLQRDHSYGKWYISRREYGQKTGEE